jgi:hypothetical protein
MSGLVLCVVTCLAPQFGHAALFEVTEERLGALPTAFDRGRSPVEVLAAPNGERLGTLPTELDLDARELRSSEDGRCVFWVAKENGGERGVVNGRPGPLLNQVVRQDDVYHMGMPPPTEIKSMHSPMLSPTGGRAAYLGRKGGRETWVMDTTPGPWFDEVWRPVMSDNGKLVCHWGKRGDAWIPVINGIERPASEACGYFVVPPNGRRAGYWAKRGGKWGPVVDGRGNFAYCAIAYIVFSPDGSRWAYVAMRGAKWVVGIDGREVAHSEKQLAPPTFSPDSRRVAYCVVARAKKYAVIDGAKSPAYELVYGFDFSPNSSRVAYWFRRDGEWHHWIDGEEGPAADQPGHETHFSPDSQHYAYVAGPPGAQRLWVDGKPGPPHGSVTFRGFSQDGEHFVAEADHGTVLLNHREVGQGAFPELSPSGLRLAYKTTGTWVVDGVRGPIKPWGCCVDFSPDGQHVAYVGWDEGGPVAVIDQQMKGPISRQAPEEIIFSPDSRFVAYAAADRQAEGNAEKVRVTINDEPGPAYDFVAGAHLRFNNDGSLEYMAIRDRVLYYVKHVPTDED